MLQFKVFNIPLIDNDNKLEWMNSFLEHVDIKRLSSQVVDNQYWSILIGYTLDGDAPEPGVKKPAKIAYEHSQLNADEFEIYDKLRNWRNLRAKDMGVPEYFILNNQTLATLSKAKPTNKEALANIAGIGEKKIESYGDEVIALINQKG